MATNLSLRGHILLCLQGFRGEGYSPGFVENMKKIHQRLLQNSKTEILLEDKPDIICQACPHLNGGCTLHGPQTEKEMAKQDQEVLQRLGLQVGQVSTWEDILLKISQKIAGKDLKDICGNCPWLPLGYCAKGMDALKAP